MTTKPKHKPEDTLSESAKNMIRQWLLSTFDFVGREEYEQRLDTIHVLAKRCAELERYGKYIAPTADFSRHAPQS